jgi:uncharacterized protein with beta-barrel porin domain
MNQDRKIVIPGVAIYNPFSASGWRDDLRSDMPYNAKSTNTSHNFSLHLASGYDLWQRDGWYFCPRIEGNAVFSHNSGFTESGADELNIRVNSFNNYYLEGGAGVEASKVFATAAVRGNFIATVRVLGIYGAGFGDNLTGEFQRSGNSFSVPLEQLKQLYAVPEASLRWQVNERLSLNATYRGRFGSEYLQHTGSIGLGWGF